MEAGVGNGVENDVESVLIRVGGALAVERGGRAVELPPSRKVRALLAYLALAARPVTRSHLCDLLWDVPNDPRGELRWCLSKIRGILPAGRVVASGDTVALAGCVIADDGEGELLEGLELDRSPGFQAWLTAQRRAFRESRIARLEERAARDDLAAIEAWLQAAPFERRAHERLLAVLARQGRIREGDDHVEAAARRFMDEGLDCTFLREAWRAAKARRIAPPAEARASVSVARFDLADEIVAHLSRLRTVFVVHGESDFHVAGSRRADGTVSVELSAGGGVVWAETLVAQADTADRLAASIAAEIEMVERNRALLAPPGELNAWQAYHRGLWHMYRFDKAENERARQFFAEAVRRDATFSRAHAGLSFTHFQNAFQGWSEREAQTGLALAAAGQGVMADERDPAAHWALGRALWLRGDAGHAIAELERAVALSPNFAQGHYALAFVHAQEGDPRIAVSSADYARMLSPHDPLLFGMYAARAMALARLERFDEAADWAVKASTRPNAHQHVQALAAYTLAMAGSVDEARVQAATVRKARPRYGVKDFLGAFRFDSRGAAAYRAAAGLVTA